MPTKKLEGAAEFPKSVFEDREVPGFEVGHQRAVLVQHADVDWKEDDLGPEDRALILAGEER
jgi:hypothetical protein